MDVLRAENARLIALLEANGIAWKKPADPVLVQSPPKESERSSLSTDEKVALFMRLFRGRTDVYPMRWESKETGKFGYFPAFLNEWRVDILIQKDKPLSFIRCTEHCLSR